MAFDGLTLRAIACELKSLIGYKIDKVFEPTKNDIVLGLYGERNKFALSICIDSKFYRINLTTHPKPNPTTSLNFSMLLRKHIIGYKIKNILTFGLERIVVFELEPFDPYDENIKYLIVELMGKHSNIILTDKNKIIIDSIRHTKTSNNSYRNIFPREQYILPKSDKHEIESIVDFNEFYKIIQKDIETTTIEKAISNNFTGISVNHINYFMKNLSIDGASKSDIEKLYNHIKSILAEADNCNLSFEQINEKDYSLIISTDTSTPFDCNFFIDDFYYNNETTSDFISYRNNVLKLILSVLKKYNKRLLNINDKLNDCDSMDTYKLYGELLTANLYKFNNEHLNSLELLNYNTGKNITIPLDRKFTVNENTKRYYKKYNKLKNALEIVQKQKQETEQELQYIESIVYELENTTTIEEVHTIYEEISENVIFKNNNTVSKKQQKKKINKKKSNITFNPLSFKINDYTVLVGRNNKENDWLTTKHATPSDLWFHTKDIHGSHVILKTDGNINIEEAVLYECAKLAAQHSKGKNSSNVPVDYAQVKYVKKPNGAKPGMVIYTHNKTLYVNP